MVKQVRAERTRQALIDAAAVEFDRQGYAGTSLSAVHRACGVTMGALTFHFPTKADLVGGVCRQAEGLTRETLARLAPDRPPLPDCRSLPGEPVRPDGGLPPVAEFTLAVARLLDEEVTVRAAARLSREHAVASPWHAVWRDALRELLARARVPSDAGSDRLELLAVYLTAGAEAALREGCTGAEVRAQLECLWHFVLRTECPPDRTRLRAHVHEPPRR
ncbi:TetR family transcriptional regulator [Streptomyces sp. WMMC940]|uniref:TetR family transcriptional regulator n=1 Tax=Streptomyces sp. WMMC940 TaxID=3015153 RepID=UPI0022B6F02B|nr:TetR family transcriptional regulator [Streptomyces sp. WMMC940]MCZ7458940.1 TetR family transcriptional regulator [Streptomyces sp. WMMC940]